jgi:hypothetical protein
MKRLWVVLLCALLGSCQTVTVISDESSRDSDNPNQPNLPGCEAAVQTVRVNPFGYGCSGGDEPANSSGVLPLNCTARVTATPKGPGGIDVPDTIHGPNITWFIKSGASHIMVLDDPTQPFNKNVRGLSVGPFELAATVCNVTGVWSGQVTEETT